MTEQLHTLSACSACHRGFPPGELISHGPSIAYCQECHEDYEEQYGMDVMEDEGGVSYWSDRCETCGERWEDCIMFRGGDE